MYGLKSKKYRSLAHQTPITYLQDYFGFAVPLLPKVHSPNSVMTQIRQGEESYETLQYLLLKITL
jgi:hypothetical protein